MKNYELSLVLDSKATAAKKKAISEKLEKMVSTFKGKVGKVEDFGEKAYGIVLLFPLELTAEAAKTILTKIRLDEEIKKSLLIRK